MSWAVLWYWGGWWLDAISVDRFSIEWKQASLTETKCSVEHDIGILVLIRCHTETT